MKKSVLIRNNLLEGGGVEKVLHDLAIYLDRCGYRVTIVTDEDKREAFDKTYPSSIRYIPVMPAWKDYQGLSLARIKQRIAWEWHRCRMLALKKRRFDLVIAMKEGESMLDAAAYRAARRYGWIHIDYRNLYWTKRVFGTQENEVRCMQQYDQIICVSNAVRESVMETIGDPGNLCVRYNPINVSDILEKSANASSIIRKKDRPLFVAVGRLDEQKNYLLLLEACNQLKDQYDFEVWIVGEGSQRKELEDYIASHGLNGVKLLGEHKNPYPIMKQADWLVSTSQCESYGLVLQEALILGVPVMTTICPAVKEVVDSRFAKIVTNDLQGVSDGLREVLEHPQLRKAYHDRICKAYLADELWEKRLEDIRLLLEGKK